MQIKLWKNFSKKYNSTKQPSADTAIPIEAKLKAPTSIEAPTFTILGNNTEYNYAYAFNHYYTIDNIIQNTNGTSDIICSQDLFATWKTNIGNYYAHVARSASASNNMLPDAQVQSTNDIVYSATSDGNLLSGFNINGNYAVKTVGKTGYGTYVMSLSTLDNIFNTFYNNPVNFETVEEGLNALFVANASPANYVKSIKWFPFNIGSGQAKVSSCGITVGSAPSSLVVPSIFAGCVVPVPYSQAGTIYYGDWRDYDSRFVTCVVYLPGFGSVTVDPKFLKQQMQVSYYIDTETTDAEIYLISGGSIIGTYSGKGGVDTMYAGLGGSSVAALGNFAANSIAGLSLNPVSFANNTAKNLQSTVQELMNPPQSVCGSAGNRSQWVNAPYVRCSITVRGTTDKPTNVSGNPLNRNVQINTLSGYVQTVNASIDIPSLGNDRNTLNAMMDSGFYYE